LGCTLALLAAGALAVGAAQGAGPLQRFDESEGQLDIVAWPGTLERGASDKRFDWVTGFEKATGCKLRVKTANTSDEMVAMMNEGGVDLVIAAGDASLRLIAGGRVQELNLKLVPSYARIDRRLQDAPWHKVRGKHYGVPYQWGYNVLMYNTEVFKEPPGSWNVVFEDMLLPDGKPNKGRIQAFDGPIYVADAALYLMSRNPALGIKDPYELNEAQYKAVLALLRQQRKLVTRYWRDAYLQVEDFASEGFVASSAWQFQANLLKSKKRPVATVVPKEGVTGWADTTMMHAKAKHPNCAYRWLEHSISRKLQGDLAAWFGSVPVRLDACRGNPLLGDQGCERHGLGSFDKVHFWRTPVANCKTQGGKCVPYYRWVSDYIAVLGGR
jgi:putative spermidine/putrescine transport system substrate-binding protein